MGAVTPAGQGFASEVKGRRRWQAGCKESFWSGNLPFLLTRMTNFGYSQQCNRWQQQVSILLLVTDCLLNVIPRKNGGCEVGHNLCNRYAGTMDSDHAVGK